MVRRIRHSTQEHEGFVGSLANVLKIFKVRGCGAGTEAEDTIVMIWGRENCPVQGGQWSLPLLSSTRSPSLLLFLSGSNSEYLSSQWITFPCSGGTSPHIFLLENQLLEHARCAAPPSCPSCRDIKIRNIKLIMHPLYMAIIYSHTGKRELFPI